MVGPIAEDDGIHIAICLDAAAEHAATVLLHSIRCSRTSSRPVSVYVFVKDVSSGFLAYLDRVSSLEFTVTAVDVCRDFEGIRTRDHLSSAALFRLLLPQHLPTLKKVLYLDADTVVLKDLAPLFETDLQGFALAAVPDFALMNGELSWNKATIESSGRTYKSNTYISSVVGLSSPCSKSYFNSGVMVIDLDKWREVSISDYCYRILRDNDLKFLDQDALNRFFQGCYRELDRRWNAFAFCIEPLRIRLAVRWTKAARDWAAVRTQWRDDPWIIHYAGPHKPWAPDAPPTKANSIWWRLAQETPVWEAMLRERRSEDLARVDHAVL